MALTFLTKGSKVFTSITLNTSWGEFSTDTPHPNTHLLLDTDRHVKQPLFFVACLKTSSEQSLSAFSSLCFTEEATYFGCEDPQHSFL